MTSMDAGCRHGRSSSGDYFADPRGLRGTLALTAMALRNQAQNQAALKLLGVCKGDSVIEIGCGPGMGLRRAARLVGRNGFVAGADQSCWAVHYASHVVHDYVLRGSATVVCAPVADLPFRDMMFDKAYAVNSFPFWPDPARALYEIARVLAPQGRLVVTQRASNLDCPTDFAGAARGMERSTQASALLKTLGWRILDERVDADGPRLLAVSVLAEKPNL
jgi:SAM-dependent methyltransferase